MRLKALRDEAAHAYFDPVFPPGEIDITVDANNHPTDPIIRLVMHELLHVAMSESIVARLDATLEEVVILSLDTYLWTYMNSSKQRLAKWEKLIERKLVILEGQKADVSLEDQVKR